MAIGLDNHSTFTLTHLFNLLCKRECLYCGEPASLVDMFHLKGYCLPCCPQNTTALIKCLEDEAWARKMAIKTRRLVLAQMGTWEEKMEQVRETVHEVGGVRLVVDGKGMGKV